MRTHFLLLLVLVSTLFGCSPSLLFTAEQFPDVKSNTSVPIEWHGSWKANDSSTSCYISHDTISLDGFNYKVIQANLDLGLDSNNGRDKLIFQDNWCFLSFYKQHDSIPKISGYQLLVGNIDENGRILCWEMSYDYFLKHRLLDEVPALKFEYKNLNEDGSVKVIEPVITYVELPAGKNKHSYNNIINQLAIASEVYPCLCSKSFDFSFYKKVALSRTPDMILTKSNSILKRKQNRTEKRYKRITAKNTERGLIKRIKLDM